MLCRTFRFAAISMAYVGILGLLGNAHAQSNTDTSANKPKQRTPSIPDDGRLNQPKLESNKKSEDEPPRWKPVAEEKNQSSSQKDQSRDVDRDVFFLGDAGGAERPSAVFPVVDQFPAEAENASKSQAKDKAPPSAVKPSSTTQTPPVIWSLANAANAPLSPFFLWIADSTGPVAISPNASPAPSPKALPADNDSSNGTGINRSGSSRDRIEPTEKVSEPSRPSSVDDKAASLLLGVPPSNSENVDTGEPPKMPATPVVVQSPVATDSECGEEDEATEVMVTDEPIDDVRISEAPEHPAAPVGSGALDSNSKASIHPEVATPPVASSSKTDATKRPRPIRIPFDSEEDINDVQTPSPIRNKSGSASTELDEERRQEEPSIDSKSSGANREDQGVDALKAMKPGMHKGGSQSSDGMESRKVAPIVSKNPLSPEDARRLARCLECTNYYLTHPESTSVRSPWAVMHALIAFGGDYELQHGNGRVNAIGWMCHNGTCRTQRIFTPRGNGFVPNVGGGVQGHEGQFLAILAQSNVPLDYPIQIGNKAFTVEDLVRYEMATCKERSELTFKLIGLSYYLDSNKQWRANDGKVWSIQKLLQEELAQPIVGAACGGTHRLMGYSFSVRQRQLQGQPLNGQYARAQKFITEYVEYTWRLQNPDGSFSTSWYEGRGMEPNDERKVQTTGHMLEWLMYTLPDNEVNQPRVQKSIDFLISKIYDNKEHKWPIGPRGHATRSIKLYQSRCEEIREINPTLLTPANTRSASSTPARVNPRANVRK